MLKIDLMTKKDEKTVMDMVMGFYNSPAVSHNVPRSTLQRTFDAAVKGNQGLDGYLLKNDDDVVGFSYITEYYACEVGGKNIMIEEIFLNEKARGKGFGSAFIEFVFQKYSYAKRFRLEVSAENKQVVQLYKKLGFEFLDYGQMVRDML